MNFLSHSETSNSFDGHADAKFIIDRSARKKSLCILSLALLSGLNTARSDVATGP
jgi:hypothetical protein